MQNWPGPGSGARRAAGRPGDGAPVLVLDRSAPQPDRPPRLDDEQRRVVEHRGSHLLVLAGPGTGKTTTLTELVVGWLGAARARPGAERVLALTFGRRAARELAERIARRLGSGPQPVVSTFHAFAYGLVRAHADPVAFLTPPRLLSAAEQDVRVSELLAHAVAEGRLRWPEELAGAVGTRGIAEQVRLLMGRARAHGLDGRVLAARGRSERIPAWVAVGSFLEEYLDTLGFEGTMDYADLIARATGLVAGGDHRARRIRESLDLIVVDEYQDTDPAQVRFVRHLARGGAQVVVVGDPDQAIYGFRGADVGGLLRFREQFADPVTGAPAEIVVLRTSRRFPRPIAAAAHGVLGAAPLGPLPAAVQRLHRRPVVADEPAEVSVRTYPSTAAEAADIADHLVRAHAGIGREAALAWSQMAVLVRNPAQSAAVLARGLRTAGVPVALPPDELALHQEPAVGVLTTLLELAVDGPARHPGAGPTLLSGPLGRIDPVTVRALGRVVLGAGGTGNPGATESPDRPRGSDAALTAALVAGRIPGAAAPPPGFERVCRALSAARDAAEADAMVGEVLWAAWTATDWPERLRRSALGSASGPSPAHRDLDALVTLFGLANRLPGQLRGRPGVRAFLDQVASLRLPADAADRIDSSRDEVRLLSAHRAKGLEWELVVVAGVQEGAWPDLRLRSDLLQAGRVGADGASDAPSVADLMAEERRLMYVACTRARSSLLVTAVAEPVDGGAEPSRFLRDLGVTTEAHGTVRRVPVRVEALVAELRRAAAAPVVRRADGSPDPDVEALRGAAVSRLALLAARALPGRTGAAGAAQPGRPVHLAHQLRPALPSTWWGVATLTGRPVTPPGHGVAVPEAGRSKPGEALPAQAQPARPQPGDPVRLSPSSVEQLVTCPMRWFLERRAGAGRPPGAAATVGVLVHGVAKAVADGRVEASPGAVAAILDELWDAMPFPAAYQRRNERERVQRMLEAFLAWNAATGRSVLGTEAEFTYQVTGPEGPVEVRGAVDRIDRTPQGAVRVVDYKTGRSAASADATARHPQLGVYQAAVRAGAFAGVPAEPGGGELVHLGDLDRHGYPKVRVQEALEGGWTWIDDLVTEAGILAAGPGYPARPNARCGSCSFQALCPARSRQVTDPQPAGSVHRPQVGRAG